MDLSYKCLEYLGIGTEAAVYKVEFHGGIYALKAYFHRGDDENSPISKAHSNAEYHNLELVDGIPGIPDPIHLFGEVNNPQSEIGGISSLRGKAA